MTRKPKVGEKLTLFAFAAKSRSGFSVPVTCVYAYDRDDTVMRGRMLARKCPVQVRLPDGTIADVTRDDLDVD